MINELHAANIIEYAHNNSKSRELQQKNLGIKKYFLNGFIFFRNFIYVKMQK